MHQDFVLLVIVKEVPESNWPAHVSVIEVMYYGANI